MRVTLCLSIRHFPQFFIFSLFHIRFKEQWSVNWKDKNDSVGCARETLAKRAHMDVFQQGHSVTNRSALLWLNYTFET